MFRRLPATTGQRGFAPPDLPRILSNKRLGLVSAFCLVTFAANASEPFVFEGGGSKLSAQVAEAQAIFMHGSPSVQFRLADDTADAFANMTGQLIGRNLALSICDRVLVEVTVRERLDGHGIVNMPDIDAATAVVEIAAGQAECSTLDAHFND